MSRTLMSADEVIDALAGTAAVARLTGRPMQAVSNWRRARRLPADTFLILSGALAKFGCTAPPALWGITDPDSIGSIAAPESDGSSGE